MFKNLDQLHNINSSVTIQGTPEGFDMREIVGSLRERFVAYKGSLTTPPCSEAVHWLIAKRVRKISSSDVGLFHLLQFQYFFKDFF